MGYVREIDDQERETLLLRERDGVVELALLLPRRVLAGPHRLDPDGFLQAVEGVSHFVYLAERARIGLPATRLELELQAEVDKFALLTIEPAPDDPLPRQALRQQLFERVRFAHARGTVDGERYRLANRLAARYALRLDSGQAPESLRRQLRRFYRAGQTDKISLAQAA